MRKIITYPNQSLLRGNKFINKQAMTLQVVSDLKFHDEGNKSYLILGSFLELNQLRQIE